jgi:predicted lysophospholipase L1 biosynthesis ABC-type transport system permease subunit
MPLKVVGIVADTRRSYHYPVEPTIYVPFPSDPAARPWFLMSIAVRAKADPAELAPALRQCVSQMDPSAPVEIARISHIMAARELQSPRFRTWLLAWCAALALAIAAVGVFGITAYAASRRTHEIGVRLAVGASAGHVRRLMLLQLVAPLALGLAVGTAGALAAGRALGSLLFEVKPTDATALSAAVVILGAVALLAAYLPARRSSQLDPMTVLREP